MALTIMTATQTAREGSRLDILDVFPVGLPDFALKSTQASQSALWRYYTLPFLVTEVVLLLPYTFILELYSTWYLC